MIILKTNLGDIHIEVDAKKAPITAKNFVDYVKNGFYDGTIFHRVIKNFMIQGGGFTEDMSEKSTKKEIENEAKNGLRNAKYTIAMARTMMPHSASSQFFINTTNNSSLDYPAQDGWGYCVFGEVVEGHAVVDKINLVKTGHHGMHADVPDEAVIVEKAIVKAATKKKAPVKKAVVKKTVKKTAVKKTTVKKTAKKAPVKKTTKKAPVKKATAKKAVIKKTATKKTTTKKAAPKKPTKKKAVVKKPAK
ncbi:Peptidyl-prolyl cis-trans isomerase PpiB (EC [Bathymodiolus thermophilus thioautotrophic gill symbiont]|uniref:Peptidyl-prolyl cis-trans isomerase n=3 Tax=Bathymodiolus thermophilus thioautotrophic gill symbiont TaxID=2360 RepID=A0A8H8XBJ1_9GAMM|nr:Peptidyl-prolyl cis-trans isomerase PpiB (EC [Bathymodiolus thermophilus thioautotrophic gill symbiont]